LTDLEDWSSTNWGWGSEDQENLDKTNAGISTTDSTSEKKHISWLDECIIANSPTGDVLVIAKGPRAIFLTSKLQQMMTLTGYFIVKFLRGLVTIHSR